MGNSPLLELVNRLSGKAVIGADVKEADLRNVEVESLIANIVAHVDASGNAVVGKQDLDKIISTMKERKVPVQVEVIRSADFKPAAKDIEASFKARNVRVDRTTSNVSDFVDYFQDRFGKLREVMKAHGNGLGGAIGSLENVKQYMEGRELTVMGMVYDKVVTAKGNVMITLEDESGTVRILFMKPAQKGKDEKNELFDAAMRMMKDDVVSVKGRTWNKFIIANKLFWPDIPIHLMSKSEEDVAIAFVSDTHVGHKLFMEAQYGKFLEWINGSMDRRRELAEKIKYLVIGGDLVDGIGIYPEQEKELVINDIYKQYSVFFNLLDNIPDYIEVFVIAGNHDAVQKAEPQPAIGSNLMGDFKRDNVHIMTNPCYLNLHGVRVLMYHGTSLDSVIRSVPGCTYASPTDAMREVLKRRHLAPVYGGNIVVPSKGDSLVIEEVPDILHMGHVHKNGYENYHGTALVNSGTWQARTGFQVKQGHIPSPCLLPVYETKSMQMSVMDFNGA